MRPRPLGIAALAFGLIAASADAKDRKVAESIEGTWQLTSAITNGQESPDSFLNQTKAKFAEKSYSQIVDGKAVEEGTYKLDLEKLPKTIDFVIEKGQDKGKTQLGIYELDGDTLKLCVAASGSEIRPKSFDGKAGSNQTLFVWKRMKD